MVAGFVISPATAAPLSVVFKSRRVFFFFVFFEREDDGERCLVVFKFRWARFFGLDCDDVAKFDCRVVEVEVEVVMVF